MKCNGWKWHKTSLYKTWNNVKVIFFKDNSTPDFFIYKHSALYKYP